jgi:hypothetical protein
MLETLNVTKSIALDSDKAWRAIAAIGGLDRGFRSSQAAGSRVQASARHE